MSSNLTSSVLRSRQSEFEGYETVKFCGGGTFGRVFLVRKPNHAGLRIAKTVDLTSDVVSENSAYLEANLLLGLAHPNVVACYEAFIQDHYLVMIMEYCHGNDLASCLNNLRVSGVRFTEQEVKRMLWQLLTAFDFIHSKQVLHRDLKPSNILVDHKGNLKLADFGVAKVLHLGSCAQTSAGTPNYMPPEMCKGRPYTYHSDMWSLGCVLYEIITLKPAFDGDSLMALCWKVCFEVPEAIQGDDPPFSTELVGILHSLLSKEPADRLLPSQLLQSSYFAEASIPLHPVDTESEEEIAEGPHDADTSASEHDDEDRLGKPEDWETHPEESNSSIPQAPAYQVGPCAKRHSPLHSIPELMAGISATTTASSDRRDLLHGLAAKQELGAISEAASSESPDADCTVHKTIFTKLTVQILMQQLDIMYALARASSSWDVWVHNDPDLECKFDSLPDRHRPRADFNDDTLENFMNSPVTLGAFMKVVSEHGLGISSEEAELLGVWLSGMFNRRCTMMDLALRIAPGSESSTSDPTVVCGLDPSITFDYLMKLLNTLLADDRWTDLPEPVDPTVFRSCLVKRLRNSGLKKLNLEGLLVALMWKTSDGGILIKRTQKVMLRYVQESPLKRSDGSPSSHSSPSSGKMSLEDQGQPPFSDEEGPADVVFTTNTDAPLRSWQYQPKPNLSKQRCSCNHAQQRYRPAAGIGRLQQLEEPMRRMIKRRNPKEQMVLVRRPPYLAAPMICNHETRAPTDLHRSMSVSVCGINYSPQPPRPARNSSALTQLAASHHSQKLHQQASSLRYQREQQMHSDSIALMRQAQVRSSSMEGFLPPSRNESNTQDEDNGNWRKTTRYPRCGCDSGWYDTVDAGTPTNNSCTTDPRFLPTRDVHGSSGDNDDDEEDSTDEAKSTITSEDSSSAGRVVVPSAYGIPAGHRKRVKAAISNWAVNAISAVQVADEIFASVLTQWLDGQESSAPSLERSCAEAETALTGLVIQATNLRWALVELPAIRQNIKAQIHRVAQLLEVIRNLPRDIAACSSRREGVYLRGLEEIMKCSISVLEAFDFVARDDGIMYILNILKMRKGLFHDRLIPIYRKRRSSNNELIFTLLEITHNAKWARNCCLAELNQPNPRQVLVRNSSLQHFSNSNTNNHLLNSYATQSDDDEEEQQHCWPDDPRTNYLRYRPVMHVSQQWDAAEDSEQFTRRVINNRTRPASSGSSPVNFKKQSPSYSAELEPENNYHSRHKDRTRQQWKPERLLHHKSATGAFRPGGARRPVKTENIDVRYRSVRPTVEAASRPENVVAIRKPNRRGSMEVLPSQKSTTIPGLSPVRKEQTEDCFGFVSGAFDSMNGSSMRIQPSNRTGAYQPRCAVDDSGWRAWRKQHHGGQQRHGN